MLKDVLATTHDESQCEGFHPVHNINIRVYETNKGALDFKEWSDKVASQNTLGGLYEMDFEGDFNAAGEPIQLLEVTAYSPLLTIDALEGLYECYKIDEKNKLTESKSALS